MPKSVYLAGPEVFLPDAREILDSLPAALAEADPVVIDRMLHTLKGAAVNIGLNDVASLANAMRRSPPNAAGLETLANKINAHKRLLVA